MMISWVDLGAGYRLAVKQHPLVEMAMQFAVVRGTRRLCEPEAFSIQALLIARHIRHQPWPSFDGDHLRMETGADKVNGQVTVYLDNHSVGACAVAQLNKAVDEARRASHSQA